MKHSFAVQLLKMTLSLVISWHGDPCVGFSLDGAGITANNGRCCCVGAVTSARAATKKDSDPPPTRKEDNKAMAFLRKIGKVGGSSNQFTSFMGVDEGPAGKTSSGGIKTVRKAKSAYTECTESGIVDDMSETFPFTSSGTEWAAVSDRVMGGVSSGSISRETVDGQTANVLRGRVSLENNGGFVQMATNLALDPSVSDYVDASKYDGIELDALYKGDDETGFNIHLKNKACQRQFSSYRATFQLPKGVWKTVRLPWSDFIGHGPGAESTRFDSTTLRRLGIVAIGKEMDVCLAVSGVRFYSVF